MTKKQCKVLLSKEAAHDVGRKTCDAKYDHHHCEACGYPINDREYKDDKYCGSCEFEFGLGMTP